MTAKKKTYRHRLPMIYTAKDNRNESSEYLESIPIPPELRIISAYSGETWYMLSHIFLHFPFVPKGRRYLRNKPIIIGKRTLRI